MGYITSVLGLQARSRRYARNASRALGLRRSLVVSRAEAAERRGAAVPAPRLVAGVSKPDL